MAVANTKAYYDVATITAVKVLWYKPLPLTGHLPRCNYPGVCTIKLLIAVI
jgi:hypothetical protein